MRTSRRFDELLWTIAVARILLGPHAHLQAPPNLSYDEFPRLLDAGIDDWGGVSPVTIDHVNPEAPWPELDRLRQGDGEPRPRARTSASRLSGGGGSPGTTWSIPRVMPAVLRTSDSLGLAREDGWSPGEDVSIPRSSPLVTPCRSTHAHGGRGSGRRRSRGCFRARGHERDRVLPAADSLRREVCGDEVSYVVTRNIQYTNVCYFRCGFCAFSKGKLAANLRGAPYFVPHDEIVRRCPGSLGARGNRGLPPGRDPPCVHRGLLPVRRSRRSRRLFPACMCRCVLVSGEMAGSGDARASRSRTTSRRCGTPASAPFRARLRRFSTTTCGR